MYRISCVWVVRCNYQLPPNTQLLNPGQTKLTLTPAACHTWRWKRMTWPLVFYINSSSLKLKRDRISKIFTVKAELKKKKARWNSFNKICISGFFNLFNIQESERFLNLYCSVLLSISINIQDKCPSYYIEKLDAFRNVLFFFLFCEVCISSSGMLYVIGWFQGLCCLPRP